jgi:SAM-dependent methyltransferase
MVLDRVHGQLVHTRRVRVLAERLAPLFGQGARVLDIGCGDGLLARLIADRRPDLSIEGIDVLVRPAAGTHIAVRPFDGRHIDAPDDAYDAAMFVDVLHHTDDPEALVAEAARVARECLVIKDHTRDGLFAGRTLAFMDWVGNARHGVALPYNYLSRKQWQAMFERRGLAVEAWQDRLGLYPAWARWVFERKLHFVAKLAHRRDAQIAENPKGGPPF